MGGRFQGDPAVGYRDSAPRTWPNHRGEPAPEAAYWVPPDSAIGEVITAWSNQTRSGFVSLGAKQRAMAIVGGTAVAGTFGFLLGLALSWLLNAVVGVHPPIWAPYAVSVALLAGLFLWLAQPRAACSYVGTEGIAEHTKRPFRDTHKVLRFVDAQDLLVTQTARYVNGAYQGTDFGFTWRDADGNKLFFGGGTRFEEGVWKGVPSPAWDFLSEAERRWNVLRWTRYRAEWRRDGFVRFGDIVVEPGRITIDGKAIVDEELGSIDIEQGMLRVSRKDAKRSLFRNEGVVTRRLADVPNVQLLLPALSELGGFAL
ncbi:MAG: hypothetical protein AB7S26_31375 [Sandaracinaceae bacterium]